MDRISCLIVSCFITVACLLAMTLPAVAESNCPAGATCRCVPTTFTKCKADAQGRQYDCREFKGEKCTVLSGPGSGSKAKVALPDEPTVDPSTRGKEAAPKRTAPSSRD